MARWPTAIYFLLLLYFQDLILFQVVIGSDKKGYIFQLLFNLEVVSEM